MYLNEKGNIVFSRPCIKFSVYSVDIATCIVSCALACKELCAVLMFIWFWLNSVNWSFLIFHVCFTVNKTMERYIHIHRTFSVSAGNFNNYIHSKFASKLVVKHGVLKHSRLLPYWQLLLIIFWLYCKITFSVNKHIICKLTFCKIRLTSFCVR